MEPISSPRAVSQTPPDDDVGDAAVAYVPKHGKPGEWWCRLDPVEDAITTFMRRVGIRLLRHSLAVIFIWFGALELSGPRDQDRWT